MAILLSELEEEQYFLSGWASDYTKRGFRYWRGENSQVLAAGYVQLEHSKNWMWAIYAPDESVIFSGVAKGKSRKMLRKMKNELNRVLKDYCELTHPEEIDDWLQDWLRYNSEE